MVVKDFLLLLGKFFKHPEGRKYHPGKHAGKQYGGGKGMSQGA